MAAQVAGRVADAAAAAEAFEVLADAEGTNIPTYARFCRIAADRPELHGLLLEAPVGQRLPVLVLAALHDVVLRHPELALARWYPSVTGQDPPPEDPEAALLEAVRVHRTELVELVRTRQVQTNEVNRCVAWRVALAHAAADDGRPLHVVELGASAGLNLLFDRYAYRFEGPDGAVEVGEAGSPVRLATTLRGPSPWPLSEPLPAVGSRVGLDLHPMDPSDPVDARWLAACTWPEQRVRYERMSAAVALAAQDPPRIEEGDLVDDLAPLLRQAPDGTHVVVLSSWVLAYVERERRSALLDVLTAEAGELAGQGGRLSLLTLEADHVLPWLPAPPLPDDAPGELRHASLLVHTEPGPAGPVATPLARCQAHLAWCEPLTT